SSTAVGGSLPGAKVQEIGTALGEVRATQCDLVRATVPVRTRGTLQERACIIRSDLERRVGDEGAMRPGADVEHLRDSVFGPQPVAVQMAVLDGRRAGDREVNGERVCCRELDDVAGRDAVLVHHSFVDADLANVAIRLAGTAVHGSQATRVK